MDEQIAINESDVSFEILFHQNPHPMWIVEVATMRFLQVNEAAINHYGYTYQEFMAISLGDIRPRAQHRSMKGLLKRIRHNETVGKDISHLKKDGTVIHVQITSYCVNFHDKECRMVLINDITEQKIKDQKIKEAWTQVYQTLESITDGFITLNNDWKITYWNKEAENTFGITKKKALNKAFWRLCTKGKEHELYHRFSQAKKSGERAMFEIYMDRYDKWLGVTAYPGKSGLTIYFQDMTSQKRDEEQLILKNKHLDEIAYINSHIIRKPIANIMGIVNSLEDEMVGYEYFEKTLQMLKTSAEDLDKVVMFINSSVEQGHTMPDAIRKRRIMN